MIGNIQSTLASLMNSDEELYANFLKYVKEEEISPAMKDVMKEIGRPIEKLKSVWFFVIIFLDE